MDWLIKGEYMNSENKLFEEPRPVDALFPSADRVKQIAKNCCVKPPFGCGKPIMGFKDKLSEKEYRISGLCQECQDKIFEE